MIDPIIGLVCAIILNVLAHLLLSRRVSKLEHRSNLAQIVEQGLNLHHKAEYEVMRTVDQPNVGQKL